MANRGDREPGPGARLGSFVAAREPAAAAELGEDVLVLVQRPERREPGPARWRRLDLEPHALGRRHLGETAVGAVAGDRPDAGQPGNSWRRSCRAAVTSCVRAKPDSSATGGPTISRSRVRFVPIVRPPRPTDSWNLGPELGPAGGLRVDHDHRGPRLSIVEHPDARPLARRRPAPTPGSSPAPPLGPYRGRCPGALGQVRHWQPVRARKSTAESPIRITRFVRQSSHNRRPVSRP